MLVINKALTIPPQSKMEMMLKVIRTLSSTATTWLVESVPEGQSVEVAGALVSTDGDEITVRLLNTHSNSNELCKGKTIAILESIAQEQLLETISSIGEKSQVLEQKHEQLVVLESGDTLMDDEQQQLFTVLTEFTDVFANGSDDFGRTSTLETHHLSDNLFNESHPTDVRRQGSYSLRCWLRMSSNPQAVPGHLPSYRLEKKIARLVCIDYRKVNSVTQKDAYPLPCVDDTLDTLSGSR